MRKDIEAPRPEAEVAPSDPGKSPLMFTLVVFLVPLVIVLALAVSGVTR